MHMPMPMRRKIKSLFVLVMLCFLFMRKNKKLICALYFAPLFLGEKKLKKNPMPSCCFFRREKHHCLKTLRCSYVLCALEETAKLFCISNSHFCSRTSTPAPQFPAGKLLLLLLGRFLAPSLWLPTARCRWCHYCWRCALLYWLQSQIFQTRMQSCCLICRLLQ